MNPHPALATTQRVVFDRLPWEQSTPIPEPESTEYAAYSLMLGTKNVRFRVSKTTPTKLGLFVTTWIRSDEGPIRPFADSDGIDLLIIHAEQDGHCGQFVFPRRSYSGGAYFQGTGAKENALFEFILRGCVRPTNKRYLPRPGRARSFCHWREILTSKGSCTSTAATSSQGSELPRALPNKFSPKIEENSLKSLMVFSAIFKLCKIEEWVKK